jgi:hypothetical protein
MSVVANYKTSYAGKSQITDINYTKNDICSSTRPRMMIIVIYWLID